MATIELTDSEKRVINEQLDGTFEQTLAPEEDKQVLMRVTEKAEALLDELDAYDEVDGDMISWFWNKYQEQEAAQ